MNKTIKYNYYHWGPFLYATSLTSEELEKIKTLCSKNYQIIDLIWLVYYYMNTN